MAFFRRRKTEESNAPVTVVGKQDFNFKDSNGNDVRVFDFRGLSSSVKPSTWQGKALDNGSTFLETDTGIASIYDGTS